MALSDDFSRGLIQKSTYIRLAIASLRHDQGDTYQVQVPLAGVTLAEVLAEASLMVRNELVDINLSPFTITWTQPELLPSFSSSAVQAMQVGGRGYLYFAIGADNQAKAKTQQVDPARLYSFYRMSRSDFLAELSRLLESKTAIIDLSSLSVQWLNRSVPAAREFDSIATAVTQLRKEIGEAIASIPTPLAPDFSPIFNELNNLAAEINERQLRGDYVLQPAWTESLNNFSREITRLEQAIASKQASGNYVLTNDSRLSDARTPTTHTHQDLLDRLTVIEAKPPASAFALGIDCGRTTLSNPIIDTSGNYFINDCYFSGGSGGNNGVSTTTNTDVPALYINERFGTSTYTIPVAAGNYTVKLLFAENFHSAIGQRVFNIDIQGVRVLTNFDIFKDAGGGRKALIKSFPGIVTNASKQIIIKVYDPGTIMAIQLVREG